nr:hypothetical protein [uncultured Glaciecola sp.]
MDITVDYCIFGGGMVGGAMAIGLSKLGYKVAVIEAHKPKPFDKADLPDLRVSALNPPHSALVNALQCMGQSNSDAMSAIPAAFGVGKQCQSAAFRGVTNRRILFRAFC